MKIYRIISYRQEKQQKSLEQMKDIKVSYKYT
jgi:hypothetical protein